MNLKLLFRIFFGLNAVFVLGAVVSPEAMLESFGMNYNADVGLMIQFAMICLLYTSPSPRDRG